VYDPSPCPACVIAQQYPSVTLVSLSFRSCKERFSARSKSAISEEFLLLKNSVCLKFGKAGNVCAVNSQWSEHGVHSAVLDTACTISTHNHTAFGSNLSLRIEGQQILRKVKTRATVTEYSLWRILPALCFA